MVGGARGDPRSGTAGVLRRSWPYVACMLVAPAAAWLAAAQAALPAAACALLGIGLSLRAAQSAHRTGTQLEQARIALSGLPRGGDMAGVPSTSRDPLTGLADRRAFEPLLAQALPRAARAGDVEPAALLFINLDQFRVINECCGRSAGDALLERVAEVLQQQMRAGDVVARLGGDEFGVLLGACSAACALRVADTLREALRGLRFSHGGRGFPVAASIGAVELGAAWSDAAAALGAAEAACRLAKEHGRDRVRLHQPGDAELALREGMLHWVSRIQHALDQGRLRLYAQPIAPAAPQARQQPRPAHMELLLRMLDDDDRPIAPMAFLPAAERFGMSTAIDRWVVGTAFRRLGASGSGGPAMCAINLSAASLSDERFLDFVLHERARWAVQASRVCFEITETAMISHFEQALRFVERLRGLGFVFALDDFGTGMSSFAYLKRLPVDYLKIDGSFVKDMLHDPVDRAMVEAINHVGHVMGIRTVAEFVEHDEARRSLHDIGVDFVQGYGIGKPVPF